MLTSAKKCLRALGSQQTQPPQWDTHDTPENVKLFQSRAIALYPPVSQLAPHHDILWTFNALQTFPKY